MVNIAGLPCQDLTKANPVRKGLAGKRSGLFTELTRLWRALRRAWRGARLHRLAENVQRMPLKDELAISRELGLAPIAVPSDLFSWCNRPRLLWMDWVPADADGLWLERTAHELYSKWRVRGHPDRGPPEQWLRKRSV